MRTVVEGQTAGLEFIGRLKVRRFAGIITGLEKLLHEGIFRLDAEGVHLSQLNSERTCYIGVAIPAGWFREYMIKEERTVAVGLSELKNALNLCTNLLSIRIGESMLEVEGEDGVGRVTLLDGSLEPAKAPRLKHEARIRMTGRAFRSMLQSKKQFDYAYMITNTEGDFSFVYTGESGEDETVVLHRSEGLLSVENLGFREEEGANLEYREVKAFYSLRLLDLVSPFVPDTLQVTLEYATEQPLVARTEKVTLAMAPRVERR